jgi:hypothetical protein
MPFAMADATTLTEAGYVGAERRAAPYRTDENNQTKGDGESSNRFLCNDF